MADYVIRHGCRSAQGVRPKNEDRFVADGSQHLFLVADGMGGQEKGEQASGLAAEIIPRVVHEILDAMHDENGYEEASERELVEALLAIRRSASVQDQVDRLRRQFVILKRTS